MYPERTQEAPHVSTHLPPSARHPFRQSSFLLKLQAWHCASPSFLHLHLDDVPLRGLHLHVLVHMRLSVFLFSLDLPGLPDLARPSFCQHPL